MKRTPHSIVFTSGAVLANGLLLCVFVVGPTRVLQDEAELRRTAAARRAALTVSVVDQPRLKRAVFSHPQAPLAVLPVNYNGNPVLQAGTAGLRTSIPSRIP